MKRALHACAVIGVERADALGDVVNISPSDLFFREHDFAFDKTRGGQTPEVTRQYVNFGFYRLDPAWRRLPQWGFLALILFLPVALFALLPEATPAAVLLPLSLIASLFGWIAYIYCAEWLRDQSPRAPIGV